MSEQLPPVEPVLRRQLTRRSSGSMPAGLLADTLTRLDPAPRRRWAWRVPRIVVAFGGMAAVALLAVALVLVPALRTSPTPAFSGYPADRALTTAELARVLAGPELPVNTTIVASVTIEANQDACPLNSRPTVGVVAGMGSQVCVIGQLAAQFSATFDPRVTGTFAFRYLAPGYLGLLGQITPVSESRLAFRVADEWPQQQGQTFLVDGYLGATGLTRVQCDAIETPDFGDILNPSGYEPCRQSWLSEDGSPAPVYEGWGSLSTPARSGAAEPSAAPSTDWLAVHEKARYVMAGGARQIDSIPLETTRGVYVVKQVSGPCPDASPVDSRGCSVWQVTARVADVSLPQATPTPGRTTRQLTGYPADRALTAAEVADLMSGPQLAINTTFVATVTIDARNDVCPMNRAPTIGVLEGMPSQVCAMGQGVSDFLKTDKVSGTFVFQYWAPGYLGLLGEVAPANANHLAYGINLGWPKEGRYLVHAWLYRQTTGDPALCPAQTADPSGNFACASYSLGGDGTTAATSIKFTVKVANTVTSLPVGEGVFLLSGASGEIEARLSDNPFAEVAAPSPTPSPSEPAATPQISKTGYPFDRALTSAELSAVLAAGKLDVDAVVVAGLTLEPKPGCSGLPANSGSDYGIGGVSPQICVSNISQKAATITGTFVLTYRGENLFIAGGQFVPASAFSLVFGPNDSWPVPTANEKSFLVAGYLVRGNGVARISSLPGARTPDDSMSPAVDVADGIAIGALTSSDFRVFIVGAAMVENGKVSPNPQPHYAVRVLTDISGVDTSPTPLAAASPVALPSSPAGAEPLGLWGSGNRPFTVAELPALWVADPNHLANRIVIVKGPVPAGYLCWSAGQADAGISPPPCHIAVEPSQIAAEGYWVVQVGADGKLDVLGEIRAADSGFVFTPGSLPMTGRDGLFVVDGYLRVEARDCANASAMPSPCDPWSILSDKPTDSNPQTEIGLQNGAFRLIAGEAGDPTSEGPAVRGLFLIKLGNGEPTLLAQLSTVQP